MNIQDKSEIAESSEELEDENDEEVKFDLNDISRELQREPAVKVCHVLDFCFYISQISVFFFFSGKSTILT